MPAPGDPPASSHPRGEVREAGLRELARDRAEVVSRSTTLASCLVGGQDLGKEWVVEQVRLAARREGFETLLCRAEADDALAPLSLFRGALTSWEHKAREPAAEEGRSTHGRDGQTVGETTERDPGPGEGLLGLSALVLGAGIGPRPAPGSHASAPSAQVEYERLVRSLSDPSQTAQEKRARLLSQIRRFLVDRAREAPLLLALEDLQLADHVSADLIAVLLEWRPEAPLWLLLTYTQEEELYPALRRALERTFLSQVAVRRPLSPLSSAELRTLLQEHLSTKAPLPGTVLEEVVERSEGLPGAALRLVRAYQTQGALPGRDPQAAEAVEDPGGTLTEDQERTLAVAAVAGPTVPFELLRRATGESEERAAELVEELVHRGLLMERPGGAFGFAEESVRQKVYRDLTAARRRVLHRKIGEALEGMPGGGDAARVFALTHHFTQGKSDEKALEYLRVAVELARDAGSLPRERELLEQALSVHQRCRPKDIRGEAKLLQELGAVAYALGADDAATQALSRARDLLKNVHEGGAPYAGVLLDLARVTARRGDTAIAHTLAEEAVSRFQETGDDLGLASVRRFRSRLSYSAGDYASAREDLQGCLDALTRAHAPPVELGRALTALADVEFMLDPSSRETSTKKLEDGITLLFQGGDRDGALFALLGRAAIEYSLDDEPAAKKTMARAMEVLPEMPEVWRLLDAMLRKASNHLAKGEMREALGHADAAVDLARALHDNEREGRALIYACDTAGRMGLLDRAEHRAREALDVGRRSNLRRTQAEALFRLAMASNMRGRVDEAKAHLSEAETIAQGVEVTRTAQTLRRDLHDALSAQGE